MPFQPTRPLSSSQACNIAATRALREADVIVATSIGAADAQLLAACGIYPDDEDDDERKAGARRKAAVATGPGRSSGRSANSPRADPPPLVPLRHDRPGLPERRAGKPRPDRVDE